MLKKKKGNSILQIIVIFLALLLAVMSIATFTKFKITAYGEKSKNALTYSNLSIFATNNIDMDLLSQSPDKNIIMIKDPNYALQVWEENLKYNFGLDSTYTPKSSSNFIKSKVDIKNYILYNVNALTNDVTVYELNPETLLFSETDYPSGKGVIKTPEGTTVNITTLYTDIGFTINVVPGHNQYVQVSKTTGAYKLSKN